MTRRGKYQPDRYIVDIFIYTISTQVRATHGATRATGHAVRGRVPGVQGRPLWPGGLRAECDSQFK